jgi:Na+/citrate or Na+/malate symporter
MHSYLCAMVRILLLTVLLLTGVYFLSGSLIGAYIHPHIQYIIIFQAALATLAHIIGKQGLNNKSQAYTYFMGGSMFRLLFSLGILTVYLFLYKQSRNGIIWATVDFLFIYIIYAVMEIATFLSNLRRGSGHQTNL